MTRRSDSRPGECTLWLDCKSQHPPLHPRPGAPLYRVLYTGCHALAQCGRMQVLLSNSQAAARRRITPGAPRVLGAPHRRQRPALRVLRTLCCACCAARLLGGGLKARGDRVPVDQLVNKGGLGGASGECAHIW